MADQQRHGRLGRRLPVRLAADLELLVLLVVAPLDLGGVVQHGGRRPDDVAVLGGRCEAGLQHVSGGDQVGVGEGVAVDLADLGGDRVDLADVLLGEVLLRRDVEPRSGGKAYRLSGAGNATTRSAGEEYLFDPFLSAALSVLLR